MRVGTLEEWALIGSTEWVEEVEDSLQAHAIAYLNEDDVTNGTLFEGMASPSLKPLLREVTRAVPDPGGRGSVYDTWLARVHDAGRLVVANPGGGSDFVPFTDHLGIPSFSVGFTGPSGVYHSTYDNFDWIERFGDPTWSAHRALAQLVSLTALRLANATVLPLDYAACGDELATLTATVDSGVLARGWHVPTTKLRDALNGLAAAGRTFAGVRDSVLAGSVTAPRAATANRWLMEVERRLTRAEGLRGRRWYRSLEFSPDVDDGYGTMVFPSVSEAVRYADPELVEREMADLVVHLDAARDAVDSAAQALR